MFLAIDHVTSKHTSQIMCNIFSEADTTLKNLHSRVWHSSRKQALQTGMGPADAKEPLVEQAMVHALCDPPCHA